MAATVASIPRQLHAHSDTHKFNEPFASARSETWNFDGYRL